MYHYSAQPHLSPCTEPTCLLPDLWLFPSSGVFFPSSMYLNLLHPQSPGQRMLLSHNFFSDHLQALETYCLILFRCTCHTGLYWRLVLMYLTDSTWTDWQMNQVTSSTTQFYLVLTKTFKSLLRTRKVALTAKTQPGTYHQLGTSTAMRWLGTDVEGWVLCSQSHSRNRMNEDKK